MFSKHVPTLRVINLYRGFLFFSLDLLKREQGVLVGQKLRHSALTMIAESLSTLTLTWLDICHYSYL
jgi:hypothetical protein